MSRANLSRRLCFLINLPLGAITIIVILIFFKSPQQAAVENLGWKARVKDFGKFNLARKTSCFGSYKA